jgi:hypothetical protein
MTCAAGLERDSLRAEVERLTPYVSKAILTHGGTMLCSPQVGVAFNEQQARAEKAEAERDALAKELGNIANAKPHAWGDMSDDFQAWAQNRARHALAAMKGTP